MTTNKEKFLALVSKEKTDTLEKNSERIKNRAMLRESQKIAIKVLKKLEETGWSQKDLANAMNVSPQQVNKIVKGQENLTLETQIRLQNILGIPVLASFYEEKADRAGEFILIVEKSLQQFETVVGQVSDNYQAAKIIKMECNYFSNEYFYKEVI